MNEPQIKHLTDLMFGRHSVLSCLETDGGKVEKIWIQKGLHFPDRLNSLIHSVSKTGTTLHFVDRQALDRLTNRASHQGIALRMAATQYLDLEDWLLTKNNLPATLLVLDGIQDSGNIGAIFRSAAAAKVDAIILPRHGIAPLGATAMKASAGTLNHMNAIRVGNLRNCLQTLRLNDFYIIGVSEKSSETIIQMPLRNRMAFVIGSEDRGIRAINLKECDEVRSIPMTGPAGSLNVSAAVAIVLYEKVRGNLIGSNKIEKKLDFNKIQHRLPDAD